MNPICKALCSLGAAVLLGLALAGTAQAATSISFKMKNGNATLSNTQVTLYLSYGTELATTDATGKGSFEIGQGRGFWVEVNGQRLARFFYVDSVPEVIDIAETGVMRWRGGK